MPSPVPTHAPTPLISTVGLVFIIFGGVVALAGTGYLYWRYRPITIRKELQLDNSIMTFPLMQVDSQQALIEI